MRQANKKFLTPAEAAGRMRTVWRGALLLWLGAPMAWLLRADDALLRAFDTSGQVARLQPIFDGYARWGPFVFYAFFIALLMHGLRSRRAFCTLAGLAYLQAQVLGTLLAYAVKIGRTPLPCITCCARDPASAMPSIRSSPATP